MKSLFFWTSSLIESLHNSPDLYGPFWIYTSLGFMLAMGGEIDRYLRADKKVGQW
jgi:hypothetical protein